MKQIPKLLGIVGLAMLSLAVLHGQTASNTTQHFAKRGLAFDYPAGWSLAESTNGSEQTITLTRKGSAARIVVIQSGLTPIMDLPPVRSGAIAFKGSSNPAPSNNAAAPLQPGEATETQAQPTPPYNIHLRRGFSEDLDPCDFEANRKEIVRALTEELATELNVAPASALAATTQIGGSEVEGMQLQGVLYNKQINGAVYSTRLNRHYVSLIHVFAPNDESTKAAWDTVRTTLKVQSGVTIIGTATPGDSEPAAIAGGVLNGKALRLVQPSYPAIAAQAHASGTVVVQVTIDEAGDVATTRLVAGHPLLAAVSLEAARNSHFSPTKLCGEPVRVTGIITYNFMNR